MPVYSKGGREHRQICAKVVPLCTLLARLAACDLLSARLQPHLRRRRFQEVREVQGHPTHDSKVRFIAVLPAVAETLDRLHIVRRWATLKGTATATNNVKPLNWGKFTEILCQTSRIHCVDLATFNGKPHTDQLISCRFRQAILLNHGPRKCIPSS
jgi:hypothetical protein